MTKYPDFVSQLWIAPKQSALTAWQSRGFTSTGNFNSSPRKIQLLLLLLSSLDWQLQSYVERDSQIILNQEILETF